MATSIFDEPRFRDPEAARAYLEGLRWPKGAFCPHCGGADRQSKIEAQSERKASKGKRSTVARPGLYECGHCNQQYTVTVGTVFERSKIALHKWLMAATLLAASKKGISSHQLHRMLGVTYKTAWFMSHRLREAFTIPDAGPIGGGGKIVEADETFWGTIKGRTPKRKGRGGGWGHKHKILALVERDGRARSFHVANVDHKTLKPILQAQIAKDSHLMTDAASHYREMQREGGYLSHETTNHAAKEYAKPSRAIKGVSAHSNTVESFFGISKRGLIGTYHHVSEAHLQRYCTEFDFRFTHRQRSVKINGKWEKVGLTDDQRADMALKQIGGKRLTYRRINAAAQGA